MDEEVVEAKRVNHRALPPPVLQPLPPKADFLSTNRYSVQDRAHLCCVLSRCFTVRIGNELSRQNRPLLRALIEGIMTWGTAFSNGGELAMQNGWLVCREAGREKNVIQCSTPEFETSIRHVLGPNRVEAGFMQPFGLSIEDLFKLADCMRWLLYHQPDLTDCLCLPSSMNYINLRDHAQVEEAIRLSEKCKIRLRFRSGVYSNDLLVF